MLHIILMILKVIGWILLVIAGILLALILMVLFVPVRYEARLQKGELPFSADGRLGWLFHLISADLAFRDKVLTVRLKLLGKVLKTIHLPGETSPEPAGKAAGKEKKPKAERKRTRIHKKDPEAGDNIRPEKKKPGPEDNTEAEKKQKAEKEPVSSHVSDAASGQAKSRGGLSAKIDKALGALRNIVLRLLETPSDAGDISDRAYGAIDGKIRKIAEKAGPFTEQDALAFYKRALGWLLTFLKTCRFRRLDGYLLVGTGQPDLTGELVGFLYLALPDAAGVYDIQADFYTKTLRTDTDLEGYVRLNHLAMLGIRVLFDREFRSLLGKIRHKDGRKKQKKQKKQAR